MVMSFPIIVGFFYGFLEFFGIFMGFCFLVFGFFDNIGFVEIMFFLFPNVTTKSYWGYYWTPKKYIK